MSRQSDIEWCDDTWNVTRGCTRVSEGCRNCYAQITAARFSGPGMAYEGLARFMPRNVDGKVAANWTGKVRFVPEILLRPLKWQGARIIFVNSMSDLFHTAVTDDEIDQVMAVILVTPRHTYQILTRRADRMREYYAGDWRARVRALLLTPPEDHPLFKVDDTRAILDACATLNIGLPVPNLWLGVSVEDQDAAEARLDDLDAIRSCKVRFVSYEPAIGPVDFRRWIHNLDWIIVGGESGAGDMRPMHPAWARNVRDLCNARGVSFFFKQWGAWNPIDSWQPWVTKPQVAIRIDGARMPDEEWFDDGQRFLQTGKKAAGRLLDGRTWDEMPGGIKPRTLQKDAA